MTWLRTHIMIFDYVNYRGEKSSRRVRHPSIEFQSTDWHPEQQWILHGFDLDKSLFRSFAMKDMSNITTGYVDL